MAGTIVVAGSVAQKPGQAGHTWVFLQYLLGFRRLGWEVLFLDHLEPAMCVDAAGRPAPFDDSANLRYFLAVMRRFGLEEAFSLDYNGGERVIGQDAARVLERVRDAAFLLNVMGYLPDGAIRQAAARRVFLDIDPGFGQMWRALGLHDPFAGHDAYVTIGENIGRPDCTIPPGGLPWITMHQPVVLAHWPAQPPNPAGPFTSIATWRGANGPVDYAGQTYGLRVHEFRKFAALPRLSGSPFHLALNIHPAEVRDLALLTDNGWTLVEPAAAAGDPATYARFLADSRAEFMVAKNMYVQSRSGWVSDRSICYLAAGRPVLAQDTGLADLYPVGRGLLTFNTLEEALAGVDAINRDYAAHAHAARVLAETYFDSDIVLSGLLDKLGAT